MCDVAFMLLLDRVERLYLADYQAIATFKAAGAEIEFTTLAERVQDFEDHLSAEIDTLTDVEAEKLRILGVR